MAARKLGLSSIPVYVVAATAADAAAETIERIVQIVTNDQDLDLTDAQRARAVQQLIDLGLSVPKVAKILRTNGLAEMYVTGRTLREVLRPGARLCMGEHRWRPICG
jgi:ParB-like chromosome segregation protein Spo0J